MLEGFADEIVDDVGCQRLPHLVVVAVKVTRDQHDADSGVSLPDETREIEAVHV